MKRAFGLSLSLHVCLLMLVLGVFWSVHDDKTSVGTAPDINVYVVHSSSLVRKMRASAQVKRQPMDRQVVHEQRKGERYQRPLHHVVNKRANNAAMPIKGRHDALLIRLHNKIQSAVNADNDLIPDFLKGRQAKVRFTLHPNGAIDSLRLIQSTHVQQLDQWALSAVRASAPFRHDHLGRARSFSVAIMFS